MKQLHIIGGSDATPEEIQQRIDFTRRAMGAGPKIAVTFCRVDQVAYVISGTEAHIIDDVHGTDLAAYDLIWFRGRFAAIATEVATIAGYLTDKDVKHVNTYYSQRRGVDKVNQVYLLITHALNIPKTISAAHELLPKYVGQFLSYPVIVKDAHGSHGEKNYLVRSEPELLKILQDDTQTRFMAQEFIRSEGDYRILLAGAHQLVIHRRAVGNTHLNNTSQGAQADLIPPNEFPAQIIREARRFADICGYEIAGVDVIIDRDTGRHYFLEINSQPQVATGVFVAEKQKLVGDYLHELLSD